MLAEASFNAKPVTEPEVKPLVLAFFLVLLLVVATAAVELDVDPWAAEADEVV